MTTVMAAAALPVLLLQRGDDGGHAARQAASTSMVPDVFEAPAVVASSPRATRSAGMARQHSAGPPPLKRPGGAPTATKAPRSPDAQQGASTSQVPDAFVLYSRQQAEPR